MDPLVAKFFAAAERGVCCIGKLGKTHLGSSLKGANKVDV